MEPQTPVARVLWLEHNVEGLAHEVTSIRAQLRALVQRPPALEGADQTLADLMQQQLRVQPRSTLLANSMRPLPVRCAAG